MTLLIDNYDSFSYNLYQLIGGIDQNIIALRNDKISVDGIKKGGFSRIVLSPGPGRPENSGICPEVIKQLAGELPILGVCLGHQAICRVFGGIVGYAQRLMHGKVSEIVLDNTCPIFKNMPKKINGARYHSLAADRDSLPHELKITAETDGEIMGVMHREYPIYGVQFHPESVLTPLGRQILINFLEQ